MLASPNDKARMGDDIDGGGPPLQNDYCHYSGPVCPCLNRSSLGGSMSSKLNAKLWSNSLNLCGLLRRRIGHERVGTTNSNIVLAVKGWVSSQLQKTFSVISNCSLRMVTVHLS